MTLEKEYPNGWKSILTVVAAVIGLKYCRYGLKHYTINQPSVVNVFVTICLSSPILNQEAHEPLCSAEKQCKSISKFLQRYDHIITLINSVKKHYLFKLIECLGFFWKNLNLFHPRVFCAKFGWSNPWDSWKKSLKFRQCVFAFHFYLPLEKGVVFHLNKAESPSPQNTLCQVWLKLDLWFWSSRWKCEMITEATTTMMTDKGQSSPR